MTTVHRSTNAIYSHTKGAIDGILQKCTHIEVAEGSRILDESDRQSILEAAMTMSSEALRVLGSAYKIVDEAKAMELDQAEEGLTFLGLIGMIDPPREEVKDAIKVTKEAGITNSDDYWRSSGYGICNSERTRNCDSANLK